MIQYRRFACFLLGAWLAGSMVMDFVKAQSLHAADRFLGGPSLAAVERIHAIGRETTAVLLRHFAAEQIRWYLEQWEWAQLAIGLGLLLVLVFGRRPPKIAILCCLVMLVIALAQRLGLTPWINQFGRDADFAGPNARPPEHLLALRGAYSILEIAKIGFGLGIAGLLLLRRPADAQMFARESETEELPEKPPVSK